MKKRLLTAALVLVLLLGLLPTAVFADEGEQLLDDSSSQFSVYTGSSYPWTAGFNSYTSGNAENADTLSTLKIVAKEAGTLSFDWAVSTANRVGKFAYRTSGPYTQSSDVTNQNEDAFTGQNSDTVTGIALAAGDAIYFGYYHNSRGGTPTEEISYTATVSNISFTVDGGGSESEQTELTGPVRYDGTDGSIAYDIAIASTDDDGNVVYSYEATTLDAMTAGNLYRITATPAEGKQFYGWLRNYQYNNRTLVAYEGSTDGALTFKMDDTTYYTPVFADEGSYIARNATQFYTAQDGLSAALAGAKKDTVVVLLRDCELTEDLTIPERVTLYVPFRASWGSEESSGAYYINYKAKDRSKCTASMAGADKTYCRLTVDSGVTVTVNGTLAVGATLGYPSQSYQGHVSGPHGRVTNNGTIFVGNGGTFSSLGITDGSGLVYADDGATVREPLIIGDFAGGSNSADLYFANQMPFKRYAMQNIQCTLQMEAQTKLNALADVFALSTHNAMDITLFGTTNTSAFRTSGAANTLALTRTYEGSRSLTDGNGLLDVSGTGLTHWNFTTNLTFQPFQIDFGIKLDTGACDFAIPYNFDITVSNGTCTIPNSVKLLPGARLTVGGDATAVITGRLLALDGLVQTDMSTDRYPNRSELESAGFASSGQLIVDGTLILQEGATLGGLVQSNGGGTVKLAEGVYLENRTADLSALDVSSELKKQTLDSWASLGGNTYTGVNNFVQQDGAKGYYDENTAWYQNPAKLLIGGQLVTPEAGKTYIARALDEAATVEDRYDGLYVADGVYGRVGSSDSYGYLTASGKREMTSASYTFSRTLSAAWENSEDELEISFTVAGSDTAGSGTAGVQLSFVTERTNDGLLIKSITPVDTNNNPITGTPYVFLVKYTSDGSADGTTVARTADGWLTPAEAKGVTVQSALLGDATGDGVITSDDAVFCLRSALNLEEPSELQGLACAVSGGTKLTSDDAVLILRKALNLDSY